jgi:DNA-binding NarL/FixJ family response regulator
MLETSVRPTAIPTARELEVLQLAADGLGNREISQQLFLSEEAVKRHFQTVLLKLNSESRAQAIVVGIRHGLID